MLPEAFELVATVRVDDPATAVMMTDVASVDCHVRVTLCPSVIDLALADRVTVGVEFWLPVEAPEQERRPNEVSSITPSPMHCQVPQLSRRKIPPMDLRDFRCPARCALLLQQNQ